ncbi:RNA methyltransferase [bacterium]|nr:RNA methyltransferase [bacterium]
MAKVLDNVRIVLVNPKVPGNIGWSARGMKNMGLSGLALVDPIEYQPDEARFFAFGAEDILEKATVFVSLPEALRDVPVAFGTTRRIGRRRRAIYYLRDVAPRIVSAARANTVAVVFGNEERGLSSAELSHCDTVVTIPEETDYPSLNLSHAVTVVCYELYLASQSDSLPPLLNLASREKVEGMYGHLRRAMAAIGFDKAGGRDLLENVMTSLKRLFGRTGLEQHDVNFIRGICRRIEEKSEFLPDSWDDDVPAP